MNDEQIETLESVANTLRGMSMDPQLKDDIRAILSGSAQRIDGVKEACLEHMAGEYEDQS
ncbi:hypothetical protein ACSQ76_12475 [Roseovarius sp. B08]|uniref:hypothetical protein n=1 Tax=Roseovarius sp. B08 TaxID=3449223 RepID=UPI003EDBA16E